MQPRGSPAIEDSANAQPDRIDRTQRREIFGDEAETLSGTRNWHFRQSVFNEWLVHAQPKQGDQAQWDRHVIGFVARGVVGGIGDARHDAQQCDFEGGRLFIHQHQVTQQRQGTEAVVRQSKDRRRPQHDDTPQPVLAVVCMQQAQGELLRQRRQFGQGHRVHRAGCIWFAQA
jgi:hypothetical protein